MEWLAGLAGLWIFFQWVLPIVVLLGIAFFAYRWAQRRNASFASSEPERRDDLEDHY
jgi:hypothetical protein